MRIAGLRRLDDIDDKWYYTRHPHGERPQKGGRLILIEIY